MIKLRRYLDYLKKGAMTNGVIPPFACAMGGGTCPDPMVGHPLHPHRGMPRGARLAGQVSPAGQVMQSVPPAMARGPTSLAHALRVGRSYCETDIREPLP